MLILVGLASEQHDLVVIVVALSEQLDIAVLLNYLVPIVLQIFLTYFLILFDEF